MVNKCCYVSASVGQVSELMQQRQQSGCTTPLFAPLCQFLSFTFCPIIFHDFQKAPHITHTHTYTHTPMHMHAGTHPTLFQEYWGFTSWFWSHLTCLTGLLKETVRESKTTQNLFVQSNFCISLIDRQVHSVGCLFTSLCSLIKHLN